MGNQVRVGVFQSQDTPGLGSLYVALGVIISWKFRLGAGQHPVLFVLQCFVRAVIR